MVLRGCSTPFGSESGSRPGGAKQKTSVLQIGFAPKPVPRTSRITPPIPAPATVRPDAVAGSSAEPKTDDGSLANPSGFHRNVAAGIASAYYKHALTLKAAIVLEGVGVHPFSREGARIFGPAWIPMVSVGDQQVITLNLLAATERD